MDGKSFEDHVRECGLEDDFELQNDSGYFRHNSHNYDEQRPGRNGSDEIDYFEDYPAGEYEQIPHTGHGMLNHDTPGYPQFDEIAYFQSSDGHSYAPSSPTPTYQPSRESRRTIDQYSSQQRAAVPESHRYTGNKLSQNNAPPNRAYMQDPRSSNAQRNGNPGHDAKNNRGIRLRPVSDLPDMYRGIFKFGVFNAVQSTCFDSIMNTEENMVVSAPTGGGKTVLFELSLIAMLTSPRKRPSDKCVYVAPTKALCSERFRDWSSKFEPLGVKCCEMTGDTVQMGKSAWVTARNSTIIITTGEKWDSLTRSWHDHGDFLSEIKLFLVDEVHILNESRGSTLEVVISRMKRKGLNIRFLLVSATAPNIQDIASWVGNSTHGHGRAATVFEFGDEFRPCMLSKHVYGYPRKNQNDFQFSRMLDFKLYSVLESHSCGKPILVFCSTRKGVFTTAEQLLKELEKAQEGRQKTPWNPPRQLSRQFHDKKMEKLAKLGIGVHHAGLNLDDRRTIEELFLNGTLRVVVATSTLAVGVNLPAHTVVIKGVKVFQGTAWQEYSDLDIIQMMGRAGRPQFDKEGTAVIMCESDLENKYKNLTQGTTVLESSLHQNLAEHVNSEIGIGTIKDIRSAKEWLRNSFLCRRIQKNPGYYHIGKTTEQTWEEKMDDLVLDSIHKLKDTKLVECEKDDDDSELIATEFGEIMSKYYVRQATMAQVIGMKERPSLRDILEVISNAEELSDIRLRAGDRQIYKVMHDHPDIRYKLKRIEKACDKVFVLVQAVIGGIPLNAPEYKTAETQPSLEALGVFRHVARIARVVVEVAIVKKCGAQLKHGLELVRCLSAKAWEDRPVVLRQIDTIGEKSLKVLAENGITNFETLGRQEPSRLELLLNRRPPYGHEILHFVRDLPQYIVTVDEATVIPSSDNKPVEVDLSVSLALKGDVKDSKGKKNKDRRSQGMTTVLTVTSDLDFIDFRRISTKALKEPRTFSVVAELTKPSQSIVVQVCSENFAGVSVTRTYKPNIPAKQYPTLITRPLTAIEMDLEGLEDDPDFWNMDIDSDDDLKKTKVSTTTNISNEKSETGQRKSTIISTLDSLEKGRTEEARILPNGNRACNHTCKDKTKCRHYCCREGISDNTTHKKIATDATKGKDDTKSKEENKAKAAAKGDAQLEKLEKMHKKAGVSDSLKISEGRRIKIDKPAPLAAHPVKPKIVPDFDLRFTDVKVSHSSEISDGDLPDTKTLLKMNEKRGSSTDHYWDSDVDDLAQAVPSEELNVGSYEAKKNLDKGKLSASHSGKNKTSSIGKRHFEDEKDSNLLACASPRKKLKAAEKESSPLDGPKRERLFLSSCTNAEQSSSPRPFVKNGLLDPVNDDSNSFEEFDPFCFDNTLFEITPSDDTGLDSKMEFTKPASSPIMKQPEAKSFEQSGEKVGAPKLQTDEDNEVENIDPAWDEYEEWLKTCIITE